MLSPSFPVRPSPPCTSTLLLIKHRVTGKQDASSSATITLMIDLSEGEDIKGSSKGQDKERMEEEERTRRTPTLGITI